MTDYGEITEGGALRFTRTLPGPIERVWAFLTEADKRAQWLAGGETGQAPGSKVEFIFRNNELTPYPDDAAPDSCAEDGDESRFDGEVITYDPPRELSFTWPERDGGVTTVTMQLSETADGKVKLVLIHEGILKKSDVLGASGGWHAHLMVLEKILSGETPAPFWATHKAAEADYKVRLAAVLDQFEDD